MNDVTNRSGGADFNAEEIRVGQDVVGRDKNIYYGSPPATPHHNSLPNQPYFFGRKEELEKIANALDPEAQGWGVLISGPGGIGKTALAIRAGHLAPEQIYPIKIFLSAKVRELTLQGVEDLQDFMLPNYMTLLAELGRELGDENIAKIDPNLRANEVRRLLADKYALLVIDNLETFDEKIERPRVFQFLSRLPRSCKAIVTSRRRLDTPAEIVRLDKLERDATLDLIGTIAKRNRHIAKTTEAERVDLYEMTRGNPLLIEWLAGQLGNPKSRCHTIVDACRFMEKAPKDNDPLEFAFGDLLDTFTKHEIAVLAALTYFTQPAEVRWITEIAQIAAQQAETGLEDLADRSVLVVSENNTYLLPSLTAAFLRRARPEVIAQVGNSLVDRACTLAQENGFRETDRYPILNADWPTVAAALPLLVEGENKRLQAICNALTFFLEYSGRWDEWLLLSIQGEDRAVATQDWYNAGWQAYRVGRLYRLRGLSSEVLACADRAAKYWDLAQAGVREQAYALRLRALGHELTRNYTSAIMANQEALSLFCMLSPESEDVAILHNALASVEELFGDYAAAEGDYQDALRISKKNNFWNGVANYTGNLAKLALAQGQWTEAEQLAREALLLSEGLGRLASIAKHCQILAKACARQGRKSEGLPYAQRAVAIFAKLRSPKLEAAQAVLKECEEGATQRIDNG